MQTGVPKQTSRTGYAPERRAAILTGTLLASRLVATIGTVVDAVAQQVCVDAELPRLALEVVARRLCKRQTPLVSA